MLKKALPIALVSRFVLAACGNNATEDMPDKDETPMEDTDQRARDWTPEVNDQNPDITGPNMDGLDENSNGVIENDVLNNDDDTLEGNGNAEGGDMGANGTEDGGNTVGSENKEGKKKSTDDMSDSQ